MYGKLFAVLIQRFKNHKACVFPNKPCVKGKGHGDRAVRCFGREYRFGCYRISVFGKGFSGAFVHQRSHKEIFLAGDQVLVGDGIGQREHLGGADLLFAVHRRLRPDFGNAVIDNGNADDLLVFTDRYGIDFLVGEIAVRRLQFLNEPVAVRDFLEPKHAVLAGFGNQHSGFFCEFACVCTEQSEYGACDALFGFTVDFETLYRTVNEFVSDGFAAVRRNFHKGGILSGVLKCHGVFFVRKDIVAVGRNFLYIQLCAYWNVGLEGDITVFVAVCNFEQTILWNDRAVCGGQVLCGIEPEAHREDLAVIPDTENFILTENFGERKHRLLTVVVKLRRRFGDLHGFARIGQLHGLCRAVQHHAVRRFYFSDGIFAEIQRSAFGIAVFIGRDGIHHRAFGIAERAVRRDNILGSGDFIDSTDKPLICKDRLIQSVCFNYREENLAAFGELNTAFLRHIVLFYGYGGFRSVHLKRHRLGT